MCSEINERLDAVEELLTRPPPSISRFVEVMSGLPDLERGLCRIHYKKCGTKEFLNILQGFKKYDDGSVNAHIYLRTHIDTDINIIAKYRIFDKLPSEQQIEQEIRSPLLKQIFKNIPNLADHVKTTLGRISHTAGMY